MPKRYIRNPLLVFKNPYMVGVILLGIITYGLTFFLNPEQLLNLFSTPIPVEPVKHLGPEHTPPDNPLPIDIPDADPIVTEPKPRNPLGWVIAALFLVLFLIAIFIAFVPMW